MASHFDSTSRLLPFQSLVALTRNNCELPVESRKSQEAEFARALVFFAGKIGGQKAGTTCWMEVKSFDSRNSKCVRFVNKKKEIEPSVLAHSRVNALSKQHRMYLWVSYGLTAIAEAILVRAVLNFET